jgi:acetyl-CoA decarbonylase/synthase complex subunit delta
MDVESLEGVTIEGEIELDMDAGSGLDPQLAHMLGHVASQIARHLINISQLMR